MQQLMAFVVLITMVAFPSVAIASEGDSAGLMRSGIAAVARMSDARAESARGAQAQRSNVNNDKKTVIIVVAVATAATVATIIWYRYQVAHSGITLTF